MELNDMKRNLSVRRLLLAVSVALFAGHPLSAEEKNALVIHLKDGTCTSVLLDELPVATFSEGRLRVSSSDLSLELPRADVSRFVYAYVDPSGLAFHTMGLPGSSLVDGVLSLSGLHPDAVVRLYFDNGRLLDEAAAPSDGRVSISLAAYPSGVYMLQVDGLTYKFTKL